jgi:hypothetical protein
MMPSSKVESHKKDSTIVFQLGGNPHKGTRGAYPDEVRDIEGRRVVLPGCSQSYRSMQEKKATLVLNARLSPGIEIFFR